MRTVYACTLDFPVSNLETLRSDVWHAVGSWVDAWYRRRGSGKDLSIEWTSEDSQLSPRDGDSIKIWATMSSSTPDALLRDLEWTYPDQYDPSLRWSVRASVFGDRQRVYFTLLLRVVGSDCGI